MHGHEPAHYPAGGDAHRGLDPDTALDRFAQPRIAASHIDVDFHHLDAARLPFGGESFDTVVCTLTLCSIPDVEHALGEMRRVLRPGGQFLFLEHGLAPEPAVARWQRRLTPLQKRLGGGCHLDRETGRGSCAPAVFATERVEHYYLRRVPRFAGYMTEGFAIAGLKRTLYGRDVTSATHPDSAD